MHQPRGVVLLTQVGGNDMLQPAGVEARQQCRRCIVIQMPEWSADTFLERLRIRPLGEHVGIVIAFENQGIATGKLGFNVRGNVSGIGEQSKPARAIGKNKLTGFARIVRDGIRANGNGVDGKISVSRKQVALREAVRFRHTQRGMGAGGEPDWKIVFTRQGADAINVVTMLVGHQDGGQRAWLATESRETSLGFLQCETAVHQNRRLPALDQQPVATAAAAQQGEAQLAGAGRP